MAGRRIDDHQSWVGAAPKGYVFPDGPHKVKAESSAEGSGEVNRYEDTTEAIKAQQMQNNKQIKAHPLKPSYRN
jgi:hypothetical protein